MTQQAAKAALKEVKKEKHIFTFKGEKFEFPPEIKQLPVEAVEAYEDGKVVGFVREIMGDQWASFKAHKPTLGDLENLADSLGQAYGFKSAGESSASSDS